MYDDDIIEQVLRQAPPGASKEDACRVLEQARGNVSIAIGLLYDLMPLTTEKKPRHKIDEIREICDAHDKLMEEKMKELRASGRVKST